MNDIIQYLVKNEKLDPILKAMWEQFHVLKDQFQDSKREDSGNYSGFQYSFYQWITELEDNESFSYLHALTADHGEQVLLTLNWIGLRMRDEIAKAKVLKVPEADHDSLLRYCESEKLGQSTSNKKRHYRSDRVYTINRLAGGCIGEMWRVNKGIMQIQARLLKGQKPYTEKQRDHAHIMYKICFSICNKDLSNVPPVLLMLNGGGMFLPHTSLIPYITEVSKIVIQSYKTLALSSHSLNRIKGTMEAIKNNDSLKQMFHDAMNNINAIQEEGFTFENLEDFRAVFQRKLGHAKIADLVRGQIHKRNESRGKRGVGGQNLRCKLYSIVKTKVAKTLTKKRQAIKKKQSAKKMETTDKSEKNEITNKANSKKETLSKNVKSSKSETAKSSSEKGTAVKEPAKSKCKKGTAVKEPAKSKCKKGTAVKEPAKCKKGTAVKEPAKCKKGTAVKEPAKSKCKKETAVKETAKSKSKEGTAVKETVKSNPKKRTAKKETAQSSSKKVAANKETTKSSSKKVITKKASAKSICSKKAVYTSPPTNKRKASDLLNTPVQKRLDTKRGLVKKILSYDCDV